MNQKSLLSIATNTMHLGESTAHKEAIYVWSVQNIVQNIVQNTVQWPARKLSISGSTIVLEYIMINQCSLNQ